jgi:CRISPR/Cas system CSM-associated protein Csm4 (group 5 of RAMP superfamily)
MTAVVLTAADRCDRCGAQAYVLLSVFVPDGRDLELLLCAHHYRVHERQLVRSGVRVLLDQRRQLQTVESYA